jgi:hypothetical protein
LEGSREEVRLRDEGKRRGSGLAGKRGEETSWDIASRASPLLPPSLLLSTLSLSVVEVLGYG